MNKIIALLAASLLWFSHSASASHITCPQAGVIEQFDQQITTFDPTASYCANIVVGGDAIWSTGFEFTNPDDEFSLTVNAGQDLIGYLEVFTSSGPSGSGQLYYFDAIQAGETLTVSLFASSNASPSNPEVDWISFAVSDMPELSEIESTSVVPVPAAVWLFGSGLLGFIAVARRNKA